ncbi:unnamed protein product, partial [Brenthis ino]
MEGKLGIVLFLVLCLIWQAQAAVNCTAAGRFAEPDDTTCKNYTLCIALSDSTFASYNYVCPTTSLFNPTTSLCTTNYVCNVTSDTTNTTVNNTVCTEDGFVADPSSTNCTTYIQCVEVNGTFTESSLTCPTDTFYNPNTTLCETDYNCTSSTNDTETATPFTCSAAGRFANSTDTTCKTYYLCVLASNGTYIDYGYTCPTTSVFSPTTHLCTTSYTCPS